MSAAYSLVTTGRIESSKSIGQYNFEARYYSFIELTLRAPKTIVSSMGGVVVCNTVSTSCHGHAYTLEALPVVCFLEG